MNPASDPLEASAVTQPIRHENGLDSFQAVRIPPTAKSVRKRLGCLWLALLVLLPPLVYFFAPVRTNLLVLGIDGGLGRGDLGRADTIILTTVSPLGPSVGMLSIPRDLWVPIEGVGENRINTAYFFAEAKRPGSGASAALRVVSQNFDVPVGYYLVVRMDGLLGLIDAMGGVDIKLSKATAGFPAGTTHLDGQNALAFARSRANADDFSRMAQSQVLIKAVLQRLLQPDVWPDLPQILRSAGTVIDTNIPVWQWPRLGLAVLRAGQGGINSRVISREMVRPFTTNQGAQVLAPDWDAIGKLTVEMFGR
jgi:polyisoprenyl-teichoic acid--peptidoglycan teichoic acid transferase